MGDHEERKGIRVVIPDSIISVCKKCGKGIKIDLDGIIYNDLYTHCNYCNSYYELVTDVSRTINSKGITEGLITFNEKEIPKKKLFDRIAINGNFYNYSLFEIE